MQDRLLSRTEGDEMAGEPKVELAWWKVPGVGPVHMGIESHLSLDRDRYNIPFSGAL